MLRAAGQDGSLSAAHPQRPASAPIPALARRLVGFFPVYRAAFAGLSHSVARALCPCQSAHVPPERHGDTRVVPVAWMEATESDLSY